MTTGPRPEHRRGAYTRLARTWPARTRLARTWLAAFLGVALITALGVHPPPPAAAETDATPPRLAGPDRVATAAGVALQAFPEAGVTRTALLARADAFPDALAAAGLAGAVGGPVLLSRSDRVSPAAASTLEHLGIEQVLLLGGDAALSPAVEAELAERYEVTRLAGPDRYATAARIAEAVAAEAHDRRGAAPDTVVVVRGDSFADALTAGSPAFAQAWPILLTQRDALAPEAAAFIDERRPRRALVLGGSGAVGSAVVADLQGRGVSVERIAGPTRTATATAMADHLAQSGWQTSATVLARGDDFADALAAGPLAGGMAAPILLAQSPALLGPDAARWLADRCPDVRRIVAVGGAAAISEETLDGAHHARLDCVPLRHPLQITYRVEVEPGLDGSGFVEGLAATLGDPRGWALDGAIAFAATDAPADLTIRLASPQAIAAAHPRCRPGRSCRVDDLLLVDADRWRAPPARWGDRGLDYRHYVVNHLVGRWLGLGEVGCADGIAPVMADQTADSPCGPGPWPTPAERDRTRQRHAPSVTIAFGGDVHGEGRVANHLRAGGNPLGPVAPLLRAADLAVVNLETAVGVTGQPQAGKTYTFRAPPELMPALREAGVDVVSLANNHALDYGHSALFETIDRARSEGLHPIGAGADATAAYAPALLRAGRRTVAVVGVSRVLPAGWAAGPGRAGIASAYDVVAAERAVRAAAQQADLVVVAIHWGIELAECPDGHQLDLARRLTAAGADVVAGHHPHILQGIQRHGRALVHYSLGNFVWYHSRAPSRYTGVWTVELDGRGAVADRFDPADIDELGRPVPVSGPLAERIHADVARRSPGGGACRF
jgi:poly-gamma-glutamate capsule biosynthesis protein CapA/YwtB (metallophosphatase superfamily)/putative cell wall-binding protein